MFDADFDHDARACELTTRGTPLGATTGRSQAPAPRFAAAASIALRSLGTAVELAALVCPQGCAPTKSALSPAGGQVALAQSGDAASWEDHEFRNPIQPTSSERRKRRRFVFELRDGLRPFGSPRVSACGRKRIAHEVQVVRTHRARPDGSTYEQASFRGLARCGSVWECPTCALQIRTSRAAELTQAADVWGSRKVAMLSLTVRHGLGDDLRAVRGGLADSFRRLINGEPWKRFCSDYGVEHHVRSMEVTHGKHGWHPHLHVLFFLEARLPEDEVSEATGWLQRRWAACVRRVLGAEFVPNEHGVDLRESRRADYLTKFSFELTDPGTKRGRGQNRTPLQIAVAAASGKCAADAALWVAYCAGMRGAKMLTWSRGLREAVALDEEQTDAAVVDAEETADAEPIATLTGRAWLSVRGRRGLACAILEVAELAATRADAAARIQALVWGTAPPEVPP
jgi:hypothetical protein